ncbi:MAG: aminopeptidase, partial [Erysipelotrichaceae bacterium]|nr:aminopeptidase [Erysipelotrichaceae bacterium]
NIMTTADLPTDDRNVSFILSTGVHDGGQWEMFANIVRKYGIVPKSVFGESYQSSHSQGPNRYLNQALKREAAVLRNMIHNGATEEQLQSEKNSMLDKVYSFLCSCYNEPPCSFDLEYTDKDKNYHIVKDLTPQKFYEEYVGDLLDKTVSVINAPTKDKEFHKTYTIRYLTNVVGGHDVIHLNLTMEEMKAAIIAQLSAGKVVWFGSDVGHDGERKKGIWDDNAYNVSLMTGLDLDISKEDGLDYGFSAMNHAMVITGVNLEDGKPTKWKIENSWGSEAGNKGYYVCSDSWFDKYVYQAAIEKEYLGDLAKLADQEPIMLEAWDPMGTLAD